MIARSYASDVFNFPIVSTCFSNIYGPGQMNFSALIPGAISSGLGYSSSIPRASGEQTLDYLYFQDVVSLYLELAMLLFPSNERFRGEVFNCGVNSFLSVSEILKIIFSLLYNNKGLGEVIHKLANETIIGEIECEFINFEQVNRYTGWSLGFSFYDGMKNTINWYSDHFRCLNESIA